MQRSSKFLVLLFGFLLLSFISTNVNAQGITPSNGIAACTAGTCVPPNGCYVFKGVDGTPQFATGCTSSSTEYFNAVGGITSAGASLVARNAAQTGNVSANITAQGSGNVYFGNNGSGSLAAALDPGGAVSSGNPQVQLTPSIANGVVKVGNATYGINLDCGTAAKCQISTQPLSSDFPGYIVGNWYLPFGGQNALITGVAPGSGTIKLYPAYIKQKITIDTLGLRITTLSVGGNVQIAIYANNYTTGKPTGNALISTASMSTASAVNVNSAASLQLNPGLYWFATNSDNATSAYTSFNTSSSYISSIIGSTTQSNTLGNGQGYAGLSVSQTFGTWPDLTAGSFTESTANQTMPVVQFKVVSVP
jgi:hypothetical protein